MTTLTAGKKRSTDVDRRGSTDSASLKVFPPVSQSLCLDALSSLISSLFTFLLTCSLVLYSSQSLRILFSISFSVDVSLQWVQQGIAYDNIEEETLTVVPPLLPLDHDRHAAFTELVPHLLPQLHLYVHVHMPK